MPAMPPLPPDDELRPETDHLLKLRNDLEVTIATAHEWAGEEAKDAVEVMEHFLRHVKAIQREEMLTLGLLTAIVARADGEMLITRPELKAVDGLNFRRYNMPEGFRLAVRAPEDADDQA